MKIRQATLKDVPQIAELLHQYDIYENKLDKRHKIDSMKEIIKSQAELIKCPRVVFFVLEIDNRIEGIISGEWRLTSKGKGASFHNIFISETTRGKGYGEKLLKALENHFKKIGCKQITSFVFINNPSIKFYRKLGYSDEEGFFIRKKI